MQSKLCKFVIQGKAGKFLVEKCQRKKMVVNFLWKVCAWNFCWKCHLRLDHLTEIIRKSLGEWLWFKVHIFAAQTVLFSLSSKCFFSKSVLVWWSKLSNLLCVVLIARNAAGCPRCPDRVKWGPISHFLPLPFRWTLNRWPSQHRWAPIRRPGGWRRASMPLLLNSPITCFLSLPFQLTMVWFLLTCSKTWIGFSAAIINLEAHTAVKLWASVRCRWFQMQGSVPVRWMRYRLSARPSQTCHRLCRCLMQTSILLILILLTDSAFGGHIQLLSRGDEWKGEICSIQTWDKRCIHSKREDPDPNYPA